MALIEASADTATEPQAASMPRGARVVPLVGPQPMSLKAYLATLRHGLGMATTAILQPVTGFYLLHIMGIPMSTHWVAMSIVLYVIAPGCWLPVVRMQMRLRDLSQLAYRANMPLPAACWKAFKRWVALGVPALFAFLAIFWLMIAKPA